MKGIVMRSSRSDRAPWILLPSVLLTLSSVTVLGSHHSAEAAPQTAVPAPKPAPMAEYDDGDGDELLEHWGDPKYSHEERVQIAGMAAGFTILGVFAFSKRARRRQQSAPRATEDMTAEDMTQRRKAA